MVPPSSDRISRVPPYSLGTPLIIISSTGLSPYTAELSRTFLYNDKLVVPGLFRVRSPLLTESQLISFPLGT
jgi:hypothetical protein